MYKIQFKEKGGKRYYNLSTRKLKNKKDATKLIGKAKKDFKSRTFRIKKL